MLQQIVLPLVILWREDGERLWCFDKKWYNQIGSIYVLMFLWRILSPFKAFVVEHLQRDQKIMLNELKSGPTSTWQKY